MELGGEPGADRAETAHHHVVPDEVPHPRPGGPLAEQAEDGPDARRSRRSGGEEAGRVEGDRHLRRTGRPGGIDVDDEELQ